MPNDIIIVVVVGRPSGIAPTARATAIINAPKKLSGYKDILITNINIAIIKTVTVMILPNLLRLFCNGVSSFVEPLSMLAILPISALFPVATTTPLPLP